jgi:hypothetical protein
LADLADFAFAAPACDPELTDLFELEVAVSSRHPLEALSKTASFRAGDWQIVFDVLFRFTRAKPSRWRETSHALKEILREFPESAQCLADQRRDSVGEQLLWLSIDAFDRGSVAGSLDPARPNFVIAWREFHGRGKNRTLKSLWSDDVEGLRSQLFATGDPNINEALLVVSAGGDVFETSTDPSRKLSILAVAAQFGAVHCAQLLLANGARVGASEVFAAFRGGSVELMRMLWNAYPTANPLEAALETVKSWNAAELRWLLKHKVGALSFHDSVRLFKEACSVGSYSCASSVLDVSQSAGLQTRLLRPVGKVGRGLCGSLAYLKEGREVSFVGEESMVAEYLDELSAWLPGATEMKQLATGDGRSTASVNAFIDAAKGRAKTLTFVETENGGSISGGYLDVAWAEVHFVSDPGRMSFIFTLKNHLGVRPTKFSQKQGELGAYMGPGMGIWVGQGEGFGICQGDFRLYCGLTYEAPRQGVDAVQR